MQCLQTGDVSIGVVITDLEGADNGALMLEVLRVGEVVDGELGPESCFYPVIIFIHVICT